MSEEVEKTVMIYPAFTIYDEKADRYDFPMAAPNEDISIRRFGDLMDQEGTVFKLHPADFNLYSCGEWDLVYGVFIPAERKFIINGAHAQRKQE